MSSVESYWSTNDVRGVDWHSFRVFFKLNITWIHIYGIAMCVRLAKLSQVVLTDFDISVWFWWKCVIFCNLKFLFVGLHEWIWMCSCDVHKPKYQNRLCWNNNIGNSLPLLCDYLTDIALIASKAIISILGV